MGSLKIINMVSAEISNLMFAARCISSGAAAFGACMAEHSGARRVVPSPNAE